ncbi:unnamed protein product, partial [Didymodactylos carnosus]
MSLDVVRSLSTICSQTHFSPSVVATVPLFRPPPSCSKAVEEVILNEEARDGASTCHQTNINMLVQKDSFDVNKFLQSAADSIVDLFIVLIWMERSTVKIIVDTFEALAAAANCERAALKVVRKVGAIRNQFT